ncbi:2-amino-4-hydroxy-6-hydroxymethyldihydropteridine diphosphokinase [Shimia marina]|uniref:2-amino-4-hydroxy-6- hydroxymethyldihydropteridine diphosphokinase n=1 Tax=Shimia marina TaxID=321267 RepID=UPI00278C5EBA|nr:2-amino-4-hydroxy-6-hydroxymethyldihydropteridine diphosphokinase [Shimia marina]
MSGRSSVAKIIIFFALASAAKNSCSNAPHFTEKKVPNFGLLALGGNLPSEFGFPDQTIARAIMQLNCNGIHLRAISRFFQTPCFPAGAGPDYVNAAITIESDLMPENLLARLHEIEASFGRERTLRWGTRPLDIDLIAYGDLVRPDLETHTAWRDLPLEEQVKSTPQELILPHPRMQERAFVLAPLMDVAATWRHPVLGGTVAEFYAQLPQSARDEVRPL